MSAVELLAAAPDAAVDELARRVLALPAVAPGAPDGGIRARIREALREDDPTLPRGIWERPLKRADPRLAAALAVEALETGGCDLQVAGWLTQAWVMLDGFAGACRGLRLLHVLAGGAVHGDDPATLEQPFAWLARHLPRELGRVALTAAPNAGSGLTWEEWLAALYRDRAARASGERSAPGDATPDDVLEAAARTPTPFYLRAEGELADTVAAVAALQELLRERWAGPPPSLEPLHRAASEIRGWVAAQLAGRPAEADPAGFPHDADPFGEHDPPDPPDDPFEPYDPLPSGGPIGSRAEAYALLAAAADYLAQCEPHSAVPWLVRRAVEWGGMELGELLDTLIHEGYDLKTLRSLLGLAGDGRA
jgi:type VI secretion system protein ImpA